MLEDLLDGKSDEEKVEALESLLDDGGLEEGQERHLDRLVERYTIGEETMEAIKAAFEGVEKEDRASVLEDLIESGDYTDEALTFLEERQARQVENEEVRAELEAIRGEFEGLSKEERDEKIQELIESGDLSDDAVEKIQKNSEKRQKMGDKKSKMRDNVSEQ